MNLIEIRENNSHREKIGLSQLATRAVLLGLIALASCASASRPASGKSHRFISEDGITLKIPADSGFSLENIKLRKVIKNEMTDYYINTAIPLGAGPFIGWSVEIETEKEIKTPLDLVMDVPSDFIAKLENKYKPEVFYYGFQYGADNEIIAGIGSVLSSYDKNNRKIHATIRPSFFQKVASGEGYLLLLILGSVERGK